MLTTVVVWSALCTPERPSADEISHHLDELYRSESSRGVVRMDIKTPNYERTLKLSMLTRGDDDTLVRILEPRKEKGTATLRKGNEMWNYLLKIRKTIRIPPSMMMASWMGSDFTNDDVVSESKWADDYTAHWAGDSPKGQWCLEYKAKEDAAVAWERVVVCVDQEKLFPISEVFYDDKGRKARKMEFSKVKTIDGKPIPTQMVLTPLLKDGHRTTLTYESLEFDIPVDESMFNITQLRRGR